MTVLCRWSGFCRAASVVVFSVVAAGVVCAQSSTAKYRNPIVFQRAHLDETTGEQLLAGKLWVIEADGSGLRQLTSGKTYDEHSSFYSDQEHVLYSEFASNRYDHGAGARLIKLNIYTGTHEVVVEEAGCALHHASLSPIDDRLAYHRNCGKHRSQQVRWGEGGYEVTLEATNGVALPDGIIAMHEKSRGYKPREVSLVRSYGHGPGSKAVVLVGAKHLDRRPAVSPDGKSLAWQTNRAGGEDEIFLADIDGSNARNLTNAAGNDGHPWFSRDGQWIIFESDRSGQWDIWRIHLESGKQEPLTQSGKKYVSTRARM